MGKIYKVENFIYKSKVEPQEEGGQSTYDTYLANAGLTDNVDNQKTFFRTLSIPEDQSKFKKIIDLNIEAPPKTQFIINDSLSPILVNENGKFTWRVENDNGFIYKICFKNLDEDYTSNNVRDDLNNMMITYGYYEEN